MTDDQINIAIAQILGWKPDKWGVWRKDGKFYVETRDLPWVTSLDAMYEAEKTFANDQWWLFIEWLTDICGAGVALCISATARQRAEAFLRTMGKWETEK
jgi:hypothetical protein